MQNVSGREREGGGWQGLWMQTCCSSVSPLPNTTFEKLQSPGASGFWNKVPSCDCIQVSFFFKRTTTTATKKERNKTSPVNGDSLLHLIPFISNISASSLLWWSKHISKILCVSLQRRGGGGAIPHLLQTNQSSKTNYSTLHWDMLIPN